MHHASTSSKNSIYNYSHTNWNENAMDIIYEECGTWTNQNQQPILQTSVVFYVSNKINAMETIWTHEQQQSTLPYKTNLRANF